MAKKSIVEVNSIEEFQRITGTGEPVLVDYYAHWCGPCRALAPNIERVAAAHAGKLRVVKVNIDAQPALAERAKVGEIPALHFYRDGHKVGVLTGFRTDAALTKELTRYGLIAGMKAQASELPSDSAANALTADIAEQLSKQVETTSLHGWPLPPNDRVRRIGVAPTLFSSPASRAP